MRSSSDILVPNTTLTWKELKSNQGSSPVVITIHRNGAVKNHLATTNIKADWYGHRCFILSPWIALRNQLRACYEFSQKQVNSVYNRSLLPTRKLVSTKSQQRDVAKPHQTSLPAVKMHNTSRRLSWLFTALLTSAVSRRELFFLPTAHMRKFKQRGHLW